MLTSPFRPRKSYIGRNNAGAVAFGTQPSSLKVRHKLGPGVGRSHVIFKERGDNFVESVPKKVKYFSSLQSGCSVWDAAFRMRANDPFSDNSTRSDNSLLKRLPRAVFASQLHVLHHRGIEPGAANGSALPLSRHLMRRDRYGRINLSTPRRLILDEMEAITHCCHAAMHLREISSTLPTQRPHVSREAFALLQQIWRFLLIPELRTSMATAATKASVSVRPNERAEQALSRGQEHVHQHTTTRNMTQQPLTRTPVRKQRPVTPPDVVDGSAAHHIWYYQSAIAHHIEAYNNIDQQELNDEKNTSLRSYQHVIDGIHRPHFIGDDGPPLPLHVAQSLQLLVNILHPALLATASPTSRARVLEALTDGCALPITPGVACCALPHIPESFSQQDPAAWPLLPASSKLSTPHSHRAAESAREGAQRVPQSAAAVSMMLGLSQRASHATISFGGTIFSSSLPLPNPFFYPSSRSCLSLPSARRTDRSALLRWVPGQHHLLAARYVSTPLAAATINCLVNCQLYAQAWHYFEKWLTEALGGRSLGTLIETYGDPEAMDRVVIALSDAQTTKSTMMIGSHYQITRSSGSGWSAPTLTSVVEAALIILHQNTPERSQARYELDEKIPRVRVRGTHHDQHYIDKDHERQTTYATKCIRHSTDNFFETEGPCSILSSMNGSDHISPHQYRKNDMQSFHEKDSVVNHMRTAKAGIAADLMSTPSPVTFSFSSPLSPPCVMTSAAKTPIGKIVPPPQLQDRKGRLQQEAPSRSEAICNPRFVLRAMIHGLQTEASDRHHGIIENSMGQEGDSIWDPIGNTSVDATFPRTLWNTASYRKPALFPQNEVSSYFSLPLAILLAAAAAQMNDWLGVQRVVRCLLMQTEEDVCLPSLVSKGNDNNMKTLHRQIRSVPERHLHRWCSKAAASLHEKFTNELHNMGEAQRSCYAYCLLRSSLEMASNISCCSYWEAAAVVQGSLTFAKRINISPSLISVAPSRCNDVSRHMHLCNHQSKEQQELPPVLRSVLCGLAKEDTHNSNSAHFQCETVATGGPVTPFRSSPPEQSSVPFCDLQHHQRHEDQFARLFSAVADPTGSNPHYLVSRFLWRLMSQGSIRLALNLTVALINRADVELRFFPLCLIESLYLASRSLSLSRHHQTCRSSRNSTKSAAAQHRETTTILRDSYLRRKRLFGDDPKVEYRTTTPLASFSSDQAVSHSSSLKPSEHGVQTCLAPMIRYTLRLPDGNLRFCAVLPSDTDTMHKEWQCAGRSTVITEPTPQPEQQC